MSRTVLIIFIIILGTALLSFLLFGLFKPIAKDPLSVPKTDVSPTPSGNFPNQTTTPPSSPLPDTAPLELIKQAEDQTKVNSPDIYLANFVPFEDDRFSIDRAGIRNTPTTHYYFEAISKSSTSLENDVENWLKSIGLNDSQLNSLDIIYK